MNTLITYLLLNLILAPITILLLGKLGFYKTKDIPKAQKKKMNDKYYKHLFDAMSTPSSFGILFILNIIFYLITNSFSLTTPFGLLLLGSVILGLLGFADDIYQFFFYKKVKEWGFKARYKAIIQFIVLFIVLYFTFNSLLITIIGSFFAVFILNSFNITDGLDGLAGGILIQIIPVYFLLEYEIYGFSNYIELLNLVIVFLAVFLIFNIKPAKVWLGDSGSYALGTILAVLTLRYPLIYSISLISLFLLEGSSSLVQIVSLRILKRRVFSIAPLHLHLLNQGWTQWRVIITAWVIQFFISIITIAIIIYAR